MSQILVSLISEQTIQNLLLMKKWPDVNRHLFISTEFMEAEARQKSKWLMQAAGIQRDQAEIIVVEEDSLDDIDRELRKLKFDDDDHFLVNVTGGTKIMSIGAYTFFSHKESEIFYLNIAKNSYRKIFPEVKRKENELDVKLNLKEYLTTYGIEITNINDINHLVKQTTYTLQFYSFFNRLSEFDQKIINDLRLWRNKKKKPVAVNEIESLPTFLDRAQFPLDESGVLSKHEIDYITGGWFEEYVYTMIKEFLKLNDAEIGTSVCILRDKVDNELDIVFTHSHALYIIECKTGIFDSTAGKNILNDTLYKQYSLSKDFGLRVNPYIFTTIEKGDSKYQVRPSEIERAEHFRIKIVDGSILRDPTKRLEVLKSIKGK